MDTLPRLMGALGKNASTDTTGAGTKAAASERDAFAEAMASLSPSGGGLEASSRRLGNGRDGASDIAATGAATAETATLVQHANDWTQRIDTATPEPGTSGDSAPSPELAVAMERLQLIEQAGTQATAQGSQAVAQGTEQVARDTQAVVASGQLEAQVRLQGNTAMPRGGLAHDGMSRVNMPQQAISRDVIQQATVSRQAGIPLDATMTREAHPGAEAHRPSTAFSELPSARMQIQAQELRPSPTAQAVSAALSVAQRDPTDTTDFVPTRGDAGAASSLLDMTTSASMPAQHVGTGAPGQATTTLATTATPPAQASLTAPVGSQDWTRQLGQQLLRFSQGSGEQRIEMRLHPAELGPLSVSLKVGDQGAQAQFLSTHAPVRQALEQAIPQLREALAEQGITLGETSVGEHQQSSADDTDSGLSGSSPGLSGTDDEPAGGELVTDRQGSLEMSLDGRVDLYA
ncbi:flagellar hook-length control protein FliK [Halomonas sabkhae]|uniref:flagellar hook-length control protein FliK n=1 Tax=Halomonas sabkhae TaxID=626223 RepID=UPI0025B4E881|nr:flagellar hook-length control protein FliK [Halomonas sabkhae]MDN3524883.1 flagellar hook-length control protein FliK [Halomonas sabkhae]